jgi:hypothetical protein
MTLQAQSVSLPNLIIFLADDLGYGDASYNRVNPDFLTPNIDSLTINGVQCTNGHVTLPFCSPSRAALLTGRYQQRLGHENQPYDETNARLENNATGSGNTANRQGALFKNTGGSTSTATGYRVLFSNTDLSTGYESADSAQNGGSISQKFGQSLLSISFYFVFRT